MADLLVPITILLLCSAMIICLIRLIIGPTVADRVVAMDVLTIITIALMCVIASLFKRAIYLDAAMVYGLISFIGVITIARYLERGL